MGPLRFEWAASQMVTSLRLPSVFLAILFFFLWWTEATAAAPIYTVTDLGTLGGSGSYSYAINGIGDIAGYSTLAGDMPVDAFRYSGSALQDLGTLSGWTSSTARGINDAGEVVGFAHDLGGSTYRAFRTEASAAINPATDDLGTLGGTSSAAYGINSNGVVVGASQVSIGSSQQHAFIYAATAMTDLLTLGGTNSVAYGVNDAGQVIGWSDLAGDAATHSFLWQAGTMTDLALPDEVESEAYAINNSGDIVGAIRPGAADIWHGYLRIGATTVDMGLLPGGISTFAYGINDFDVAVGYMSTSGSDRAFRFSGSTMVNLNNLIDPSAGWVLNRAYGINNAGQITGDGMIGGEPHAFLLTPVPEPTTAALAACATMLLRGNRRRKRTPVKMRPIFPRRPHRIEVA